MFQCDTYIIGTSDAKYSLYRMYMTRKVFTGRGSNARIGINRNTNLKNEV